MADSKEKDWFAEGVKDANTALKRHNSDVSEGKDRPFNPSTVKMRGSGLKRKLYSKGFSSTVGNIS